MGDNVNTVSVARAKRCTPPRDDASNFERLSLLRSGSSNLLDDIVQSPIRGRGAPH